MAGFSAAKADKLRKAHGQEDSSTIVDAAQDRTVIEGSVEQRLRPQMARERCGSDIEKFAEYAFNKSHAAAYGVITYQTAYLKAHYPLEYMAAVLTSYTGKTDKIVHYVAACNRAGIQVLPPDVNSSGEDFTAVPARASASGSRASAASERASSSSIIAARDEAGPFTSLHDFCARVDMKQLNKKTLEALIKAGAFDSTGYTRKHLMSLMDDCVDAARQAAEGRRVGPGLDVRHVRRRGPRLRRGGPPPNGDEWDKKMKLAFEKEMLGIYVSDHPLREIAEQSARPRDYSLGDIDELQRRRRPAGSRACSRSVDRSPTEAGPDDGGRHARGPRRVDRGGAVPAGLRAVPRHGRRGHGLRLKAKLEDSDRGTKLIVQRVEPFDGERVRRAARCAIIVRPTAVRCDERPARALHEIARRTIPGRDVVELHAWDEEQDKPVECRMPDRVDKAPRPARRADRALRRRGDPGVAGRGRGGAESAERRSARYSAALYHSTVIE